MGPRTTAYSSSKWLKFFGGNVKLHRREVLRRRVIRMPRMHIRATLRVAVRLAASTQHALVRQIHSSDLGALVTKFLADHDPCATVCGTLLRSQHV